MARHAPDADENTPTVVGLRQNRFVAFETRPEQWNPVEPVSGWEWLSV